ncbi:S41 family peptidase [Pseudoduganella sp. GCM10020061]|uniref:S41 family peptidase n=1 Tax=Pseudoduganella sp. GCM10020061 TaxID=3317345 RepID=UPI003642368E
MHSAFARILLAAAFLCIVPATAAPMPAPKDMAIDAATRKSVIEGVIGRLHQHYVFPETAARVEAVLRTRLNDGAYDQITSARQFAQTLSKTLIETAGDRHMRVRYWPTPIVHGFEPEDDPKAYQEALAQEAHADHGVTRVERMSGNIGYLKIDVFPPAAFVSDVYASAMRLLNGTDALIIDLRDNRGGEPDAVALMESYFFDQPTLMNTVFERRTGKAREYWTTRDIKGPAYGQSKPIYILTSKYTFSGGEDLSYSMRARVRATLVGETTGGGANPGDMRRVQAHFSVFIPDGRAINPVTGTNWEGVGVSPDIAVAPAEALSTARILALKAVMATAQDARQRTELATLLERETAGSAQK